MFSLVDGVQSLQVCLSWIWFWPAPNAECIVRWLLFVSRHCKISGNQFEPWGGGGGGGGAAISDFPRRRQFTPTTVIGCGEGTMQRRGWWWVGCHVTQGGGYETQLSVTFDCLVAFPAGTSLLQPV